MSDMWNSVAPAWEEHAGFVDGHTAAATERLLDLAGVAEGNAVLELAAGTGGAGLAAARRVGPGGSVLLSDDAAEMVAAAGRRARELPNVTTAVFDQSAIDAPDDTFDVAISRHGLMFAEDKAAAVGEVARVLRPGGRYAAMTWGPRAENPWLGLILDAVGQQFGVEFPPPHIPGPFALDDPAQLQDAFAAGGLQETSVERIETPMRAASLEEWWGRVPKFAGPLAIALAGMEPEVRQAIEDRALKAGATAGRPDGEGVAFAGCVLIAVGRA